MPRGGPWPGLRALHRKLLRDLWRQRGQMVSIAALVMCGVATVVAMYGTLVSVRAERDTYYERYRFGDVFASATRIPAPVAAAVAAIPGVQQVSPRTSMKLSLDVPGLAAPASGRLMGYPAEGATLDRLHLVRGQLPRRSSSTDAVVSGGFAAANGIEVGDSLDAVMNGRWRRLAIVGVAISPEFLWELAGADFFSADERAFGLLWMSPDAVEAAAGMHGAFNELALDLGAGANVAAVRLAVDSLLAPYGGVGAIGRDRQPSNYILEQEFRQLRVFGLMLPSIFLAVSAFLLNVVLARLIATQRAELAALKAFGYTDREVALHYLGFAGAAVLVGSIAGLALGGWFGTLYTGMYARYFRFPDLAFRFDVASTTWAIAASAVAACAGALFSVRRAVALPPAEALRPESPERFRPLAIERLGITRLSPAARMVLRTIERRPTRAASSVIGIALAVGLLAGTLALFDAAFYMGDLIFRFSQREDVTVSFIRPVPARALLELRHMPGMLMVEGYRVVPVRVRSGAVTRTIAITGLEADGVLRRIVDDRGQGYALPPRGAAVSGSLARLLHLRRGDTLHVELIEEGGTRRAIPIAGVADELVGINIYMDRRALDALLVDRGRVSGAHLRVDGARAAELLASLKATPAIAGAASRQALIDAFDRQMLEGVRISGSIVVAFAIIIGLGVVYNGARVALSERGRELASLRVLGFTRREVAMLLLAEQGLLLLLALPVGAGLGLLLTRALATAFRQEDHHFPMIVELRTYAGAMAIVIVAAALAALLMRRRLNRMDLIAVLKTRE